MILLEGKVVAQKIKDEVKKSVQDFVNTHKKKPGLAVVQVGDDPASSVYVGHKVKACEDAGIESFKYNISANENPQKLYDLIETLNKDSRVNGVLVQMPTPDNFDYTKVLDTLDPLKDVDGITPENVGLAWSGRGRVFPCTPSGIIELLEHYKISIERRDVVVVGRSDIVGKPMAQLFLQKNATVTICHSKTKSLEEITKRADIVICAIGKRNFFSKEYFSSDAVVIDVGIHRLEDNLLCGDVFFKSVNEQVRALTPVPGGVGPLTIAQLLKNTMTLAKLQQR